jgi:hypothetical protein
MSERREQRCLQMNAVKLSNDPLALQLTAFGQEVRVCAPPDFRDWIAGYGIPVTPIGPEQRSQRSSAKCDM